MKRKFIIKSSVLRKTAAKLLVAAMIITMLPMAGSAADAGSLSESMQVSDGLTLFTRSYISSSGALTQSGWYELAPDSETYAAVASGNSLYGRSGINTAASWLGLDGKFVSGGANGDFFTVATGIPNGLVVTDGILRSSDGWHCGIGFLSDGSTIIGMPGMSVTAEWDGGKVAVDGFNKTPAKVGITLLNSDFAASSHISSESSVYLLGLTDPENSEMKIGGSIKTVVTGTWHTEQSAPIPENTMLLIVDTPHVSRMGQLAVGMEVTISVSAADERWNDAVYAVGAYQVLVKDGKIQPQTGNDVNPRTAAGVKADGTFVLYTVDGRQAGYSSGMKLSELAAEMAEIGCVDAVNLDGGGSTTLSLTYPGESAMSVINRPSDGAPRKCANFIFFVHEGGKAGRAQRLHIYPYGAVALAGAEIPFTVLATDSDWLPAQTPSSLSFSADRSLGSFSGSVLKVASNAKSGKASVSSGSRLYGETAVTVTDKVSSVSVMKNGKAVSSVNIDPGKTADLSAAATYLGRSVYASDELFKWELGGRAGTVDENGVITASDTAGASGKLTVSYGGVSATVNITVGKAAQTADDFEKAGGWQYNAPVTEIPADGSEIIREAATVTQGNDQQYVRYGYGSLGINTDFTALSEGQSEIVIARKSAISLSSPDTVEVWVKGDNSGTLLRPVLRGVETAAQPVNFTGWKRLTFDCRGASALTGFALSKGGTESCALWLDQLRVNFGGNADTMIPETSLDVVSNTSGAVGSLRGRALDPDGAALTKDSIRLTVDGTPVSFSYSADSGDVTASLSGIKLGAGLHRATLTATDPAGNISRACVSFGGTGSAGTPFADLNGHWARAYMEYLSENGVLTGEIRGGRTYANPEKRASRTEMAVIMARYLGLKTDAYSDVVLPFDDTDKIASWALPYIKAVYAEGIMKGKSVYGKLLFDPDAGVTRVETMTMLGRTLPQGYADTPLTFADADAVPSWASDALIKLCDAGVVSGYADDNTIRPNGYILRGEVASLLFKLY